MQRLLVVASLALTMTMVPAQEAEELGEMQHMLGNIFGNQLNTLRSSCCVIRDLMCPQIRRPPTSFRNSSGLSDALEQFSACVCSSGGRCTLTYPEIFLPDGADGVTYDVTFVTLASTSQYICTYSGTRTLTCHFRQSMRTGFMEWLLPGVVSGTSAAVGNSGIFGEEMEEVVEQMMERGLPPAPLPSRQCRRCVPLQCAVNVIREAQLHVTLAARQMGPYRYPQSSLYPQRPTPSVPAYSDQQRFHQCLKRNAIRPPSPTPPTTTPPDPQPSTPFPVTPPPDGRPDVTPITPIPPSINDVSSTPKTWWTTPELPATSPKPGRLSTTTQYKAFTTTDLPTTKAPPATTSSTSDVTTSRATPTPAPTTYVPPEITRILIGDSLVAVATQPTSNNVIVMPKEGTEGGGNIGVGGIAGIVTGVVLAVAAFSGCLVFAIVIARRRRKRREGLNTSASSTTPVTSSSAHTASSWHLPTHHHHHHTAHLHTVSSTQAVIDADEASIDSEDDDDVIKKIDDDDDDDDNIDMKSISSEASERYTPAHLLKSSLRPVSSTSASTTKLTSLANRPPMRKPSVTSKASSVKSGEGDDGENLYASLDETTIVPPRHSLIDDVNGASTSSKSTRSSTKNNPTYSNTDMSRRMRKSSKDEAIYAKPYAKPPRYSEVMRDDVAMTSRDGESYVNSRSASEYEGLRHPSRKPSHKYTPLSFHGAQGADERGGIMVGRGGGVGGGGGGEGVGGRERGIGGASGDPNYLHPCLPPSDESFRKSPAGLITGTQKDSTYSQSDASNPGVDRTTKPSLAGPPGRAKANTSGRRESNTPRRDSRNDDCDTRRVDNYRPTLPRRDVPGGGGGFRQDGAPKKGESASGGGSRVDRDGYLIPMPAKRQ